MKKTLLFIFLALTPFVFSLSQNNSANNNPILNSTGLTFDSLMWILDQKDIPFDIKYQIVHSDMQTLEPWDKTIEIFFKTLSLAKKAKAGQEIFTLYYSIANNYSLGRNTEKMKVYLDSASLYTEEVKDDYYIGLYYYSLSSYYIIIGEDAKSHENSYKAIDYFEKSGGKERVIIMIYYNMAITYMEVNDFSSVRSIINSMRNVCDRHYSFDSELYTNQLTTNYYNSLYEKNKIESLQDSAKYFSKKSIDLFESLPPLEQSIAKNHITYDFYSYILNELESERPNNKLIDNYISKFESLVSPTDTCRLVWYHQAKGSILTHKNEYEEAEKELNKSLDLLNKQQIGKQQTSYLALCEKLAELYEKLGNLPQVVKYRKLKETYTKQLYEEKQHKASKDIDIKYETAKKDLEISHLNEKQQEILYNRTLIVGALIIVSILFLVAFLYNRIKRLKKEQEYIKLENEVESNKQKEFINGLESERSRLAKELHDGVSNELVAIRMQINADGSKENILGALTDVHANIRNTSHALMIPIFKETKFSDILYDYVVQQRNTGININLSLTPTEDWNAISSTIGLELYRIVQESVSNAIKHGKATAISIAGVVDGDRLSLKIVDNGAGFDTTKSYSGIGLRILKDRANIINGNLNITSSSEGTEVVVDLVLKA